MGSSLDRINDRVFNAIYSRSLVYNTCWEDPAVDREALNFGPDDSVLVITSAGCNALDYALTAPKRIYAVDMNPRQNALLELKLAGIRNLEFEEFFKIFGEGWHPEFLDIYHQKLRQDLDPFGQAFWDRKAKWFFASQKSGFYFHGLSGTVARGMRIYRKFNPKLELGIQALLDADGLEDQRRIFDADVRPHMWSSRVDWLLSRQFTMNMLGVPHPQRKEVQNQHSDGVAGFIRDCIEYVFNQIPVSINYFWRLYIFGHYTKDCCPEYLREDNFKALKAGLVDRVSCSTCSVTEFLKGTEDRISKFVLLDHMDWMSSYRPQALAEEWQAIFDKATEHARTIFRSAHAWPSYLDHLMLPGSQDRVLNRLEFHPNLAVELTRRDRVHTYAGFHIADLKC